MKKIKYNLGAKQWKAPGNNKLQVLIEDFLELKGILHDSNNLEKWLQLTDNVNETSRDPMRATKCLKCAHVTCQTTLNWISKANQSCNS